jgi:UDP-glucose 4-epimerase
MKRILVTGGSGFIGRNVKESYLKDKYTLLCPSSSELNLLDLRSIIKYLKVNKIDYILHCATWDATPSSTKELSSVLANNLSMYRNLKECNGLFKKMFVLGSGADFDRRRWKNQMSEDYFGTFDSSDNYSFSKFLITRDILSSDNIFNLRLFGVYGKYEIATRVVTNTLLALRDKKSTYTILHDRKIDYLYIDDFISILDLVFSYTEELPKDLNICTGQGILISELVNQIISLEQGTLEIDIVHQSEEHYVGDNSKLLNIFPELTFTNLEECIKNYIGWFKQNYGQ